MLIIYIFFYMPYGTCKVLEGIWKYLWYLHILSFLTILNGVVHNIFFSTSCYLPLGTSWYFHCHILSDERLSLIPNTLKFLSLLVLLKHAYNEDGTSTTIKGRKNHIEEALFHRESMRSECGKRWHTPYLHSLCPSSCHFKSGFLFF
jgi:hypothetical protein